MVCRPIAKPWSDRARDTRLPGGSSVGQFRLSIFFAHPDASNPSRPTSSLLLQEDSMTAPGLIDLFSEQRLGLLPGSNISLLICWYLGLVYDWMDLSWFPSFPVSVQLGRLLAAQGRSAMELSVTGNLGHTAPHALNLSIYLNGGPLLNHHKGSLWFGRSLALRVTKHRGKPVVTKEISERGNESLPDQAV